MNNKIILCKVEDYKKDFYVPFGLLYLADVLKKNGFSPEILHIHQDDLKELYSRVKRLNPLFVGFTTLTAPSLLPTITASKKMKEIGIPVVWGGVHATILPEFCAKQDYVDYVILGEGEKTICELAYALNESKNIKNIKGLATFVKNESINTGFRDFINLDDFRPAFEHIDLSRYFTQIMECKRVLPIITSRGCPFRCGFCYNNFFNRRTWRGHSINSVVEQANFLKDEYGIDGVDFHDDMLFVKKLRAQKIIEEIGLPFFVESRATDITQDFTSWLNKNNCRILYIGAESGSNKILKMINKDITTKDVEKAVKNLKGTKIIPSLGFIIGFPGETKEDRDKTLSFIKKLERINPNLEWSLRAYSPYPGTPLWERTVKNGFEIPESNEEWAEMRRGKSLLPWLSQEEVLARKIILVFGTNKFKMRLDPKFKIFYNTFEPVIKSVFKTEKLCSQPTLNFLGKIGIKFYYSKIIRKNILKMK